MLSRGTEKFNKKIIQVTSDKEFCDKIIGFDSQNAELLFSGVKPDTASDENYSQEFTEEVIEDLDKKSDDVDESFKELSIEDSIHDSDGNCDRMLNQKASKSKIIPDTVSDKVKS